MNNLYVEQITIDKKDCSKFNTLRFDSILTIFQHLAITHSYEMKVDRVSLIESSNAFFVLTKMKIAISRLPKVDEQVVASTWPIKVTSPIKFYRDYEICSQNQVLISGTAEWCTLDGTTRMPRKISSVKYPSELNHIERRSMTYEFTRFNQDGEYIGDYKIVDSDIDVNEHTNNVVYLKMALSTYSEEEFEKKNFKGLEIHFIKETMLDQTIKLYKCENENGDFVYGELDTKRVFAVLFEK